MHFSTWFLFLCISLATAYTPGPAVLLAISNSLSIGRARALYSSLGNAVGVFIVSGAAAAGLGLILKTSALAFAALKLIGAAYLIYLGVRQWFNRSNIFVQAAEARRDAPALKLFLHGLFVATTNPKSILFFTALFPQFMSPENASPSIFLLLTTTFAACTVCSHFSYVYLAGFTRHWFAQNRRARMFNQISGLSFIGLGLGVLKLKNN